MNFTAAKRFIIFPCDSLDCFINSEFYFEDNTASRVADDGGEVIIASADAYQALRIRPQNSRTFEFANVFKITGNSIIGFAKPLDMYLQHNDRVTLTCNHFAGQMPAFIRIAPASSYSTSVLNTDAFSLDVKGNKFEGLSAGKESTVNVDNYVRSDNVVTVGLLTVAYVISLGVNRDASADSSISILNNEFVVTSVLAPAVTADNILMIGLTFDSTLPTTRIHSNTVTVPTAVQATLVQQSKAIRFAKIDGPSPYTPPTNPVVLQVSVCSNTHVNDLALNTDAAVAGAIDISPTASTPQAILPYSACSAAMMFFICAPKSCDDRQATAEKWLKFLDLETQDSSLLPTTTKCSNFDTSDTHNIDTFPSSPVPKKNPKWKLLFRTAQQQERKSCALMQVKHKPDKKL